MPDPLSGVPGSGKSTIARVIEKELLAIRLSNDEIRDRIVASNPAISQEDRERAKLIIATELLERLADEPNGLIVIDASCDRGYDDYWSWADEHKYHTVLLRMDVPKSIIEERLHERGHLGYRNTTDSLAMLDTWWYQWETLGKERVADLIIKQSTPIEVVLESVRKLAAS